MQIQDPAIWRPGTQQWVIADALRASGWDRKAAFWNIIRPMVGSDPLIFKGKREDGTYGVLPLDLPKGSAWPSQRQRAWYRTGDVLKAIKEYGWNPDESSSEDRDPDTGCGGCDNGECCGACPCCPTEPAPEPEPMPEPKPKGKRMHHAVSDYVTTLVSADVPVWLHGPAGTGKSTAAKQAAQRLGLDYYEVNLSGAMVSSVKGAQRLKDFIESQFLKAYRDGGLILIDEADAAPSPVMTAMNNAIAGDTFYNDANGEVIPRHPDFRIVATGNTLGNGSDRRFVRSKLDGATLDRFRPGFVYTGLDLILEKNIFDAILTGATDARRGEALRYYREVQRLREFVTARDNFDPLDSMRVVLDGTKAILAGAPYEAPLASITAAWQAETKAQARVPAFDYAAYAA